MRNSRSQSAQVFGRLLAAIVSVSAACGDRVTGDLETPAARTLDDRAGSATAARHLADASRSAGGPLQPDAAPAVVLEARAGDAGASGGDASANASNSGPSGQASTPANASTDAGADEHPASTRELCRARFPLRLEGSFGLGKTSWLHRHNLHVDRDGQPIMVGTFMGTIELGHETFTSSQLSSFVVKLDAECRVVWARSFRSDDQSMLQLLAVSSDRDGNVYVGGGFNGLASLDGSILLGSRRESIVVAKLTRDGAVTWARAFGSPSNHAVLSALAVDSRDRVVLWGDAAHDTSFGGAAIGGGGSTSFVAQLDPDAGHRWSRALPYTFDVAAALLPDDSIAVLGWDPGQSTRSRRFGLLSDAGEERFLGPVQWGPNGYWNAQLEADGSGRLVTARAEQETADDGAALRSAAVLETLSSTGEPLASRAVPVGDGFSFGDWNADLALDPSGAALYRIAFGSSLEYAGHTWTSRGAQDLLLIKYAPDGEPQWFLQLGDEAHEWSMGMASDSQGNVWTAHGRSSNPGSSDEDLVIVKLAP